MKSKAIQLEILGLLFVLVSFFFQSFFFEQLSSLQNEAVQYKLERKIDMIFSIVKDNYSELNPNEKGAQFWSNPDSHNQYKYAEDNKLLENVKNQTNWAKVILSSLFAFGSILIITGKYLEYTIVKSNEYDMANENNP